ncbi:MAG: hypothetical protein LUO89_01160, partial [Methanothrix sp.]|nr:hypothetical protein [Methanothrix sp.]
PDATGFGQVALLGRGGRTPDQNVKAGLRGRREGVFVFRKRGIECPLLAHSALHTSAFRAKADMAFCKNPLSRSLLG